MGQPWTQNEGLIHRSALALEAAMSAALHFLGCMEAAGLPREQADGLWRSIEEQRLILADSEAQFMRKLDLSVVTDALLDFRIFARACTAASTCLGGW